MSNNNNKKRGMTTREMKRKGIVKEQGSAQKKGGEAALNPMKSILFLLQREYVRECKVVKSVEDENGVLIDEVEHPEGLDFGQWLDSHELIVRQSSIILPKNKGGIIGKA